MIVCDCDQGKTKGLVWLKFTANCAIIEHFTRTRIRLRLSHVVLSASANSMGKTISELAQLLDARVVGEGNLEVQRVASLEAALPGDIAYLDDEKFIEAAAKSKASCVIVRAGSEVELPCQLQVKNPKLAFALV